MATIKIGIMSFAHLHASSYASCLKQLEHAEFVTIWDDDPERGAKAAQEFGVSFVRNRDAFLESDIEGVIITSENVKHREMVEAAAAAGKWILCEKPIAPAVEDAKAMVAACKRSNVGLGTAFPCRYAPTLVAAHDRISSGSLGNILAAACTNNGQFPGGWFADDALAGGGATMDHTVHVVDLLRWMTGKEFVKVYCENGCLLHDDIATDDLGSLHLEMQDGIMVSHIASWSRPKSFPTWGDVTLQIIGEKGVLEVDAFGQNVVHYNDETMRVGWLNWGGNSDLGLIADFVDAVAKRREPTITGVDGLRATQVTVAAYKSAATGEPVSI